MISIEGESGSKSVPLFDIELLLKSVCPAIQSRIRREILRQSRAETEVLELQGKILEDTLVKSLMKEQQADGWLGKAFHGYDSMESALRVLCEKDLDPAHPAFASALAALKHASRRLSSGIGKVGEILDQTGFGGSQLIRAALLAQAGHDADPLVQEQIPKALSVFSALLDYESINQVTERRRGKLVFRSQVKWPSIYHFRLLAYSHKWRDPEKVQMLAKAIWKMTEWSPIPDIYINWNGQFIAPASFGLHDLTPDLAVLDDAGWMIWFQRMELFSRLGVVLQVPALYDQIAKLREILAEGQGWFTKPLSHGYFRKWGAYTGLMLEQDWRREERRRMDLTFRSLLILHYSGCVGNILLES